MSVCCVPISDTDGIVAFRALAVSTDFSSFGIKCTSGPRIPLAGIRLRSKV